MSDCCQPLLLFYTQGFLDSLLRGKLSLAQVNLIILDDAQSAGDPHPMARVMLEFYRSALRDERPRIFGMMTPEVDSKIHYDIGILKLERLLDATMLGVSSETRDQVMALPDKPNELVIFYDPHLKLGRVDTPLQRQLRQVDLKMQQFRKLFKDAKHVYVYPFRPKRHLSLSFISFSSVSFILAEGYD